MGTQTRLSPPSRQWAPARLSIACFLLLSLSEAGAAATKAQDVVAAHLASIGSADARAAIKSRAVQGKLRFTVTVGGGGESAGKWQLLSGEHKSKFVMKFGDALWWGEQTVCDGSKCFVTAATASHDRSTFGNFLADNDSIVKDGLLGGALSGAWALENLESRHVRLEYMGIKRVDGRDLEGLEYVSGHNGMLTVKFYFDPGTHHHVLTVYSVEHAPPIASNDLANAKQLQRRYLLEERFGDFQTDAGITLPRHYDLRYSQMLQEGARDGSESSMLIGYDWSMTVDQVLENPVLDPANFRIK